MRFSRGWDAELADFEQSGNATCSTSSLACGVSGGLLRRLGASRPWSGRKRRRVGAGVGRAIIVLDPGAKSIRRVQKIVARSQAAYSSIGSCRCSVPPRGMW